MGPWVVTPDELPDPDDLALGCSVDGETVQDARTSDLIFGVPRLVAELSAVLPLLPGDVIFTGTPAGVGVARQPPRFLAARARSLETWIEGIGTIRNRCVAMTTSPGHADRHRRARTRPRAGPGPARSSARGDVALQFDAGRGTVLRLAEAGTPPMRSTPLFLTHVHSDHLVDLADLVLTRWIQRQLPHRTDASSPPRADAPGSPSGCSTVWEDDIAVRVEHVGHGGPPEVDVRRLRRVRRPPGRSGEPTATVRVQAVAVHHEPVRRRRRLPGRRTRRRRW